MSSAGVGQKIAVKRIAYKSAAAEGTCLSSAGTKGRSSSRLVPGHVVTDISLPSKYKLEVSL